MEAIILFTNHMARTGTSARINMVAVKFCMLAKIKKWVIDGIKNRNSKNKVMFTKHQMFIGPK